MNELANLLGMAGESPPQNALARMAGEDERLAGLMAQGYTREQALEMVRRMGAMSAPIQRPQPQPVYKRPIPTIGVRG